MGVWKSLAGKVAKKAAQAAVNVTGKAVDAFSGAVEKALFGDGDAKEPEPPDPFAKLKAAEAEKTKEREREKKKPGK
jgi:hypothetical protein